MRTCSDRATTACKSRAASSRLRTRSTLIKSTSSASHRSKPCSRSRWTIRLLSNPRKRKSAPRWDSRVAKSSCRRGAPRRHLPLSSVRHPSLKTGSRTISTRYSSRCRQGLRTWTLKSCSSSCFSSRHKMRTKWRRSRSLLRRKRGLRLPSRSLRTASTSSSSRRLASRAR